MKTFCLATSSSGNSFFIQSKNGTKVLVDCGLSYSKTKELLNEKGVDIKEIDALFITHEHSDHTLSLNAFLKNHDVPVYLSSGTLSALRVESSKFEIVKHHTNIKIGDLQIFVLDRFHDSVEAVSYIFNCESKKIGVFTDLGHVDSETKHILKTLDIVYFEANYCDDIVGDKDRNFHFSYVNRLISDVGHLSVEQCCNALVDFVNDSQRIILSHISQNTNTYENTYSRVRKVLQENGLNPKLYVGFATEPTEWIE